MPYIYNDCITGLTALIARVGWCAHGLLKGTRASEGRPYTIETVNQGGQSTTVSTGLQSIPIFASFPGAKHTLRSPAFSVMHWLQGVKLLLLGLSNSKKLNNV